MARIEKAIHTVVYLVGATASALAITYAIAIFTPELEEMYWSFVCNG